MEQIKLNAILFYKAVFFLTIKQRLTWEYDGVDKATTMLTNEVSSEIRFYKNSPNRDVLEFNLVYSYIDIENKRVQESISERFRETEDEFKLFSCKKLFNMIKEQSLIKTTEKELIEPIELLNEYLNIFHYNNSLVGNKAKPFDDSLFKKILCLGVE